jgi:hypothetical protein
VRFGARRTGPADAMIIARFVKCNDLDCKFDLPNSWSLMIVTGFMKWIGLVCQLVASDMWNAIVTVIRACCGLCRAITPDLSIWIHGVH